MLLPLVITCSEPPAQRTTRPLLSEGARICTMDMDTRAVGSLPSLRGGELSYVCLAS